jgi:hypothetical protein
MGHRSRQISVSNGYMAGRRDSRPLTPASNQVAPANTAARSMAVTRTASGIAKKIPQLPVTTSKLQRFGARSIIIVARIVSNPSVIAPQALLAALQSPSLYHATSPNLSATCISWPDVAVSDTYRILREIIMVRTSSCSRCTERWLGSLGIGLSCPTTTCT